MSENDQEFKILITGDAKSAVDALTQTSDAAKSLKDTASGTSESMEYLPDNLQNLGTKAQQTGDKVEEAGKKAAGSGERHRALRHILGELDRISPGLGEAMEVLSGAYIGAGEAAEGGAVGVAAFNTALQEVIMTMGPLIIAILGIEAAMTYWDLYSEKVKAAAEAQAEATKSIDGSVRQAVKAVQELNDALHPKEHNLAEKDEAVLKKQEEMLENTFNRQKELNQANRDKEMSGAGSPEEKEQIRKHFELLDTQLNDWRDKQKAAIEGTAIAAMQKQLADLKAADDKLIKESAPEYQLGTTTGDMSRYNATLAKIKKNADEAKAIREKLDDLTTQQSADASNADYNSETHRLVFSATGQGYAAPSANGPAPSADAGIDDAANKFATGRAIANFAGRGGKVSPEQQQFLIVLEQSITGQQLTFAQAVGFMEKQSASTDRAVTLIANAHMRIDAVSARLHQLEMQVSNSSFNHQ